MDRLRDVVVEVPSRHSAALESWLIGRGRMPALLPDHPEGHYRYLVKEADAKDLADIETVGGRIVKRGRKVHQ